MARTKQWKTRDETKIRICDMDDQHLANTVTMLEKKARLACREELKAAYWAESMMRGEHALDAVGNDIARMEGMDDHDAIETFLGDKACILWFDIKEEIEERKCTKK